jgi:hypothetical protein
MDQKTKYITILVFYIVSFTPFSDTIELNGNIIEADRIRSSLNLQSVRNSPTTDFFYAGFNTILFNFPAHYGSFIGLFSKTTGNQMKMFCFSNRFKAPVHKSSGWGYGSFIGWLVRLGLLVFLVLKIKNSE